MTSKEISETTTSRSEFNKAYKDYLAHKSRKGIGCSYCKYHKGENYTGKYYATHREIGSDKLPRCPSWKLASKNKKQWMNKNLKLEIEVREGWNGKYEFLEYIF